METKLPYFYLIDKNQQGDYNCVYCTNNKNKINEKELIAAHDFLLFLSYLPGTAAMSKLSSKKKGYETFTISNEGAVLYRVRLYPTANAIIKCYVSNINWTNEAKIDNCRFILPESGFSQQEKLFETKMFYNYLTNVKKNYQHPFINIGQLLRQRNISTVLNEFIEKHAYSKSGKHKIDNGSQPKKSELSKDYFYSIGSIFFRFERRKIKNFP